MRFLLLPHYPHIGPQAGLRSCGLYDIDRYASRGPCASLAAVAGRWASGTESIGALQLKPAQPQLLASRCSAAGGRLGAQSSVRPPTASGPQHASPPTSSHWEERRARTALRAQPVTAQIWPSFQLERQPPPAGGLLIDSGVVAPPFDA